ncbi:MAG: cation transporter [Clostridiales Family XIII bacterium]|jgi:predicted Co/Zn/Cd cation transporter (cation efflux family)|nr:cation transporter [Clostridiales Family XIII bacterium]
MKAEKQLISIERGALRISIWGRVFIILFELLVVWMTGSQAILIDTAFDLTELATVVLGFFLIPKWFSPRAERRPYGLAQGETWIVIVRTIMALSMSAFLLVVNILVLSHGGNAAELDEAAILELISAMLAVVVVISLKRRNRLLSSPSLTADIESWNSDVLASIGVAVALFLSALLSENVLGTFVSYIDPIIAIAFTVFLAIGPLRTMIHGFKSMTLVGAKPETVSKVGTIAGEILDRLGLGTPEYYILETGRKIWISIYLINDDDDISKKEYAAAQQEIYEALSSEFKDLYVELLPAIGTI